MAREKFSKVFQQRLNDIERDARDHGSNITAVCREARISRSTPDRWREEVPRSVEIIDDMEAALTRIKKKSGKSD